MKRALFFLLFLLILCGQVSADTKTISGTTNLDDTWMQSGFPNINRGTDDHLIASPNYKTLIRVKNVASELGVGATNITAVCSMFCYYEDGDTVKIYRTLKPWEEGIQDGEDCVDSGATWNDWNCDEKEWTTEGCACANDDGVDNSADGGACDDASRRDRKATAECQVLVNATGWWAFTISPELAQGWYDGTMLENGLFLAGTTISTYFRSTEYGSNQPFFVFTYTSEEPGEGKPGKNIMSGGIIK